MPENMQNVLIIIFVIVGSLAFVVLGILSFLFIKRKANKKKVSDLEERYNSIHDTFSTDCSNMIKRVQTIASNNSNYQSIYESTNSRFNQILKDNDKSCYLAVQSLKNLIANKSYKGIGSIIGSTKISMDTFSKEAIELNNDLQAILKKEEDLRMMIVVLKEKFRKLKQLYSDNITALDSLKDSFEEIFNHLTDLFVEFEDDLNFADYQKASKIIPEIEQLIDALNKVMVDLPYLNTLTEKVVPQKINDLEQTYKNLLQDGYPIHHLGVKQAIDEMNSKLEKCRSKLAKLSISGVSSTLENITMEITTFLNAFDTERKARKDFEAENGLINTSTYNAEKQYANLKNSLPEYQKVYKISPSYINQLDSLKELIDVMSAKKRMLDGYINSATKQPYSVLMQTIKDLSLKISKVQNVFDDFRNYLLSLKADSDNIYKFIRVYYEKMRVYENKVNLTYVKNFIDVYLDKLNFGYQYLVKLDKGLNFLPLDVMELDSIYNEAKSYFDNLFAEIDSNLVLLKRAEEFIVLDNRYRLLSLECRNSLVTVEKAFNEGDFSRASVQAANIFKRESNQEANNN